MMNTDVTESPRTPAPAAKAPSPRAERSEEAERLAQFGREIDAIRTRIEAEVGPEDVLYVTRLDRFSHTMEAIGRVLIHVSLDPLTFGAGVFALWIHKQLQATEIGHTALHGAYDGLPGAEKFQSRKHYWKVPIDEEAWRYGHNVRHHGATNVAGKDADITFGPVRLTREVKHKWVHRFQLPFSLFVMWPNFGNGMNLHFTGMNDVLSHDETELDFLPDLSPESRKLARTRFFRKFVPYFAYEYLLFPVLAGPFFPKVLLGNWLSETMRDVYSAATIFCGHVGEDVASYPVGTKPTGPGAWAKMQVEASNNYEVPWAISVLCGGLDMQIEHHLFPRLAPHRLRQIAPEVKAVCAKYGVKYRTGSWGSQLYKALAWIGKLSANTTPSDLARAVA